MIAGKKFEITDTEKRAAWKMAFVGVVCVLVYVTASYLTPFAQALFLAALLAIFLEQPKQKLVDMFGGREKLVVVGMILVIAFSIVIPFTVSSFYGVNKLADSAKVAMDQEKMNKWKAEAVEGMQDFVWEHPKSNIVLGRVIDFASKDQSQIIGMLTAGGLINKGVKGVVDFVSSTFSKIGSFTFNMLIMLIALGAFMLNGKRWLKKVILYISILRHFYPWYMSTYPPGIVNIREFNPKALKYSN